MGAVVDPFDSNTEPLSNMSVLRSTLIYLSRADWARRLVTGFPLAWRTASRFVAGESLEEALQAVRQLNARGIYATLDVLGEHTDDRTKAREAAQTILAILNAIDHESVASGVSLKLTQIGLELDESLCLGHLREIVALGAELGVFVRIDMEDSPWIDATLRLYRQVCAEFGCRYVGVVIQSYLYRSEEDVEQLMTEEARVRLCKGAYDEPPDVAFPKKQDVDANFDRITDLLVAGALAAGSPQVDPSGRVPPIPAIATHDEARIEHARESAEQAGLPAQAIEFQMLYGIRRELQESLAEAGYPVRVYVPFGTEWYPYYMRRLAERPANLWFFLSSLVRR